MPQTTGKIGDWVRRVQFDRQWQQGKYHKVQSLIANDAITACGRRMNDKPPSGWGKLEYIESMPQTWYNMCHRCENA